MLFEHNLASISHLLPSSFIQQLFTVSNNNLAIKNGNTPKWDKVLAYSLEQQKANIYYDKPYLRLDLELDLEIIKNLAPWRKGPFAFNNFYLESEWNGALKWHRLKDYIDLENKKVLDVGSGNGYFSIINALSGAELVLGLEPFLLFNYQFNFIKNLSANLGNVVIAPIRLEQINSYPMFDIVLSMGVLYHHKAPIEHLIALKKMLANNGKLILETLVVDGDDGYSLTPRNRYAGMRNVWFIPSVKTLFSWLYRCGFNKIEILNDSITTTKEQRVTEFLGSKPKSLIDFVAGDNTIEGYPRPRRAMLSCKI